MTPGARHWHGMAVIARGSNRICVQAPDEAGHCFKYLLPVDERPAAGARKRLRWAIAARWPHWDENQLELRAWRRLRQRLGSALDLRIAACHGVTLTAAGPALRCQRILGGDGGTAPSLYLLLSSPTRYSADALCAAVDAFEAWLLVHRIPLFDLNMRNLVVMDEDGSPQLVCVDVKSVVAGKEIVPYSRWVPALGRPKLRRRAERLRQLIRACIAFHHQLAAAAHPSSLSS